MGINIHQFKEYNDKYEAVAFMVNTLNDHGIYINSKSHNGLVSVGHTLAEARITGNLPGWLSFKLIKANIDACGKLAAALIHANGIGE